MINFKNITQAVETLLNASFGDDYVIERNPVRAADPFRVMRDGLKGWIGIYRGNIRYNAHASGSLPYLAELRFTIEIQVASVKSADDCEDKLCDAEKEIIDFFETNRKAGAPNGKLKGYVDNIIGYETEYEMNEDNATYYQAVLITPIAEVRT